MEGKLLIIKLVLNEASFISIAIKEILVENVIQLIFCCTVNLPLVFRFSDFDEIIICFY
jgi:hypothetical protein